ncbi:aminopeptidase P family N-terminal domain-containing protein [Mesorhizobium carmichaelinearum]|uniref:aminopeptidase P family N-terminal domain-containing protein n=1 Tax=Mesorhizobium carmichaelinearum TaxID=1208188 RepID=UPI000BA4B017
MNATVRDFKATEFQTRIQKAQELMRSENVDGLFVSSNDNYRYFTGIETNFSESLTRPWFLLIPSSGEPIAIVPAISVLSSKISKARGSSRSPLR